MSAVRFYFDYLSPYAYLAWKRIHALAEGHGRDVEPVPVLLAALLQAHGQKGPAEIPPKRLYTFKHVYRLASEAGVALSLPPSHPYNPLLALRVSSLPMPPTTRRALIDGLFGLAWGGEGDPADAAHIGKVATSVGLEDAVRVAQEQASKDRLRQQTEAGIAAGVFGVPTMIADGELFWGYDSLGHLDRFLAGEDPIDAELLARWRHLPATATRQPR